MATPVTIVIKSNDVVPVPVAGVVIDFYDTLGNFVTTNTTDANGEALQTLADGDYDLLFYKKGVSILPRQPQRITVSAAATTNIFDVSASIFKVPSSPNPSQCTVYGTLLSSDGYPRPSTRVYLTPTTEPVIVGSDTVMPGDMLEFISDNNGYISFELLRGVKYNAFIGQAEFIGQSSGQLQLTVPDVSSIELPNLFFPIPQQLSLSSTSLSLTAGSGEDRSVTYSVTYTDYSQSPSRWGNIQVSSSDPNIASASIDSGVVVVTPVSAGTATITFNRTITGGSLWTSPPTFTSDTLTVTVV